MSTGRYMNAERLVEGIQDHSNFIGHTVSISKHFIQINRALLMTTLSADIKYIEFLIRVEENFDRM